MAEKIEIEKPVVSKGLSYRFEELKNDFCIYPSEVCNSDNYSRDIPESVNLNTTKFEELLTRMYVLDYEVKEPNHYVLKLPILDNDEFVGYICRDPNGIPVYQWFFRGKNMSKRCGYSVGFTKAEIEADEGLNKLASVCELVKVSDE